ncbi:YncE family protein [Halovenus halobia]|uniref:YncE family protein n=1 Tax=Halovenus halobia TaxID=3396622 RepID=UPI003F5797BF
MDNSDPAIYPNATDSEQPRPAVSRRVLLAGSAAAGATATAGCLGGDGEDTDDGTETVVSKPTVYVFNTGDGTVSVIDSERDEVVATRAIKMTASFPSNQFTPQLIENGTDPLWLNVDDGVRAVGVGSLEQQRHIETGSGANWQEQTPDGNHVIVSAREPAHRQFKLDANPESETFGEVVAELERSEEGGRGDNDGPGPCDVTIHPDGEYAYVPDLFGETLTVIDIERFEVERQVPVEPTDGEPTEPWMGTVSWDGTTLLIENNGGDGGTESIWDVSEPARPVERVRLTQADGLGHSPLTSEIGPNSEYGYVFTRSSEDVTVVDLEADSVDDRLDLGGSAFVGSWDVSRSKLYVPIQTNNEVAVIDAEKREIVDRLDVGPEPYGATAAGIRSTRGDTATSLDRLAGEYETTYCIGQCACGHEL